MYTATLVGIVASTLTNCKENDNKKCESANYQAIEGLSLSPAQEELYLSQTCRSGCNYDSKVGCCWCPDN